MYFNHYAKSGSAAAAVFSLSMLVAACGGSGSGEGGTVPAADPAISPPVSQVQTGSASGTVLNGKTGQAVAGATVSAGTATTTTDAQGQFTLAQVGVSERVVLTVSKAEFARNFVVARIAANASANVNAALLPVALRADINVATGGTLSVPGSSAQVVIAANSLVRADGQPIAGAATFNITPINPALSPSFMPGDFTAMQGNASSPIESFGALSVSAVDASGAALNLGAGQTASLRIAVASRGTAPQSTPMFYFDTATGLWVEQGAATLVESGTTRFFEGLVPRLGAWNADKYLETVKVSGCLKDEQGQPVAGARVVTDGIDYSGTANSSTDTAGLFTVSVKKSARAALTASYGARFSNTLQLSANATDFATVPAGECLVLGGQGRNVSIKLTWGTSPSDVDSHLFTPAGDHVYYSNDGSLTEAPFANLDVDNTSGQGPEIITVSRLMVGTYRYAVRNYSGSFNPGLTDSPVRIELNAAGNVSVFTPPPGEDINRWWNVLSFAVDARCNVTVSPTNTWSITEPATVTATPAYCTPN
jgi:hypothetical protein